MMRALFQSGGAKPYIGMDISNMFFSFLLRGTSCQLALGYTAAYSRIRH